MMDYNKSDIVLVNLYPKKGDEVGKTRPCVILSDTLDNQELDTLIVVPLSTQLIDEVFPFRVRLFAKDGLEKESDVLINQIRTISKKRVLHIIGRIGEKEHQQIRDALCRVL